MTGGSSFVSADSHQVAATASSTAASSTATAPPSTAAAVGASDKATSAAPSPPTQQHYLRIGHKTYHSANPVALILSNQRDTANDDDESDDSDDDDPTTAAAAVHSTDSNPNSRRNSRPRKARGGRLNANEQQRREYLEDMESFLDDSPAVLESLMQEMHRRKPLNARNDMVEMYARVTKRKFNPEAGVSDDGDSNDGDSKDGVGGGGESNRISKRFRAMPSSPPPSAPTPTASDVPSHTKLDSSAASSEGVAPIPSSLSSQPRPFYALLSPCCAHVAPKSPFRSWRLRIGMHLFDLKAKHPRGARRA